VRVGFDALDERILPQMGVKVAFQNSENQPGGVPARITIPRAALVQDGGKAFVFLARDGRAERRAISVGETRGQETTVSSGVAPGERVILNPPPGLRDGNSIQEGKR
jgi:HlyD family secretion protein